MKELSIIKKALLYNEHFSKNWSTDFYITVSNNTTISIPIRNLLTGSYIDWGDGEIQQISNTSTATVTFTHTYVNQGQYIIKIYSDTILTFLTTSVTVLRNSVTKVKVGNNVTTWTGILNNSPLLEEIEICQNVQTITSKSFSGCTAVKKIISPFFGQKKDLQTSKANSRVLGVWFNWTAISNTSTSSPPEDYILQYSSSSTNYYYQIPKTLKTIVCTGQQFQATYAFQGCDMIEEFVFVPGNSRVDFSSMANLKKIATNEVPTTFYNLSHLKEIKINTRIDKIRRTFENCAALEKVILPTSLKTIDSYSFYNSGVKEIYGLEGVNYIYNKAFANCPNLKRLQFSDNLISIENGEVFSSCPSLEEINVINGKSKFLSKDGVLYKINNNNLNLYTYPPNKKDKLLIIEEPVKKIETQYNNINNLETLIIDSQNVDGHFNKFINLKEVRMLKDQIVINSSYSKTIEKVVFGKENMDAIMISGINFSGATNLKSVEILSDKISINSGSGSTGLFQNTGIEYIDFEKITSIGYNTFNSCKEFKGSFGYEQGTIVFGKELQNIDDGAFYGCELISNLDFSKAVNLRSIGVRAFKDCSLKGTITIPKNIETLKTECFSGADLDCIYFDANMALNNVFDAFLNCQIKELKFGKNVKNILQTFQGSGVKKVYIPKNIETIKKLAFYNCSSLEEFIIEGDPIIEQMAEKTLYYQNEENWDNGLLYIKNIYGKNYAIAEKDNNTGIYIPKPISYIPEDLFNYSTYLKGFAFIPEIKKVGLRCFLNAPNFRKVYFYKAFNPDVVLNSSGEIEKDIRENYLGHENFQKIYFEGTEEEWKIFIDNLETKWRYFSNKISEDTQFIFNAKIEEFSNDQED